MLYRVVVLSMLTYSLYAQEPVVGLGKYIIGMTTPDSLSQLGFVEQEQPYVKGTLTLPCTHIRMFIADTADVQGITVTSLWLLFYDNQLFKISCVCPEELKKSFVQYHGVGTRIAQNCLFLCVQAKEKVMLIGGDVWQQGDIRAVIAQAKGYNADCQPEQFMRLIIASEQDLTLATECDIQSRDPFGEAIDELLFK